MTIGPYHSHEIVLCSADAGPDSQRNNPGQAHFFSQEQNGWGHLEMQQRGCTVIF